MLLVIQFFVVICFFLNTDLCSPFRYQFSTETMFTEFRKKFRYKPEIITDTDASNDI